MLVDEGLVKREEYGSDLKQVRQIVRKHNKVTDLINFYYRSNDFNMLRDTTKVDYRYFLTILHQTMGGRKFEHVTAKVAKRAYEEWVKRGVSFANHAATCASRVYNYAIQMEHTTYNPWANIKRKSPPQRKVVWTHDNVVRFLEVAYSDFEYRSVGLIVQMAYEWCQRLGDMRMLQWHSLDLEGKRLNLEQSKRRSDVSLPVSDDLCEMLKEQRAMYQTLTHFVVPHPRPMGRVYKPYAMERLSKVGRRVMRLAELPEELRLMDLRRTGVTQMVEAGVSLPQVMAVTGHNHVSSVKPYVKHTYVSANNALTQRNESLI
jgi:integrase